MRHATRPLLHLAAVAALCAADPAAANNVSALVTGTPQAYPLILPGSPQVDCTSACQYTSAVSTYIHPSYDPALGVNVWTAAWPPVWAGSAVPIGTVEVQLPVPPPANANALQDGGAIGVQRESRVHYDAFPLQGGVRRADVQQWGTGRGASVASYAIRYVAPDNKGVFLEFAVPQLRRSLQDAYEVGGPSGNQPIYTLPKRMQARAAVDVYVDGLPVWSSESAQLLPQRYRDSRRTVDWGPALTGDGRVTLYLGKLGTGTRKTISLLVRSDLRGDAPICKTDSDGYGGWLERCWSQEESLSLPSRMVGSGLIKPYRPDIRVYTY